MILVDTSVWVDYLRNGETRLADLLNESLVMGHPFVTGELACGNLQNRTEVLALLGHLPQAPVADNAEVLFFIERHRLMGQGIGYVDAHLLAGTALAGNGRLWTRDKRLQGVAAKLKLGYAV